MTTDSIMRNLLLTGVLAASFATPAMATPMMQPVREGNATYITGGIGADEEQALKASASHYNLEITNADRNGSFEADTSYQITGNKGREMISATDTGPMFLAELPPGEYKVHATLGDESLVRTVKVSADKPTDLHLIWQPGE